jgi:hypothetical protein
MADSDHRSLGKNLIVTTESRDKITSHSGVRWQTYRGKLLARNNIFNSCVYIWLGDLLHTLCVTGTGTAQSLKRLGYGLDDRGSRFRFPAVAGNFSRHHRVQNGSGAHPASYLMSTGSSFPGGKAAGACSWPLTSTLQNVFMAWCLVKLRDNFLLLYTTVFNNAQSMVIAVKLFGFL